MAVQTGQTGRNLSLKQLDDRADALDRKIDSKVDEINTELGTTRREVRQLNDTVSEAITSIGDLDVKLSGSVAGLETRMVEMLASFQEETKAEMAKKNAVDPEMIRREAQIAAAEAAEAKVEIEVEEAVEGFKATRMYRYPRAVVRELKPGIPRHDHIKGGAVTTSGLWAAARYIPSFRMVVLNAITP